MPKIRQMSVVLILLSCGISMLSGILLDRGSPSGPANFRAIYYGARCVIGHSDPYDPGNFLRVYSSQSGQFPTVPQKEQLFLRALTVCVNLPTTLLLVAPLAMLAWGPSHVIWLLLVGSCVCAAALLAHDLARELGSERESRLALFLICLMMANCQVLFITGNTAGVAVGLCVVAVWCFVRQRLVWVGVLCLAISLVLKPHDSGLVWLYLLLAGGALRKRSLQTLALAALIAIPAVMWVSGASPNWSNELRSNLAATSSHGDISDPGPTSISRKGSADVIIDLQTVVSVFNDAPGFYNPLVYAICVVLLLLWGFATISGRATGAGNWYALAGIAAISMLGTYHRPYDAKLLLLAVPACPILLARGDLAGKVGVGLTSVAIVVTSDIPLAILSLLIRKLDLAAIGPAARFFTLPFTRPAPLALLATAIFFVVIRWNGSNESLDARSQEERVSRMTN